ncbi:MAG: hypothetical protein ACRDPI_01235, partial [Nocardioidaceae bacterium]
LDIGGTTATTGADGRVEVSVADLNHISSRVALASGLLNNRTMVTLTRVHPLPHTSPHVSQLAVGLSVASTVRIRLGSGHTGVSTRTVSGLRLHSVTGQVITVDPRSRSQLALTSRRAMLQHGVLKSQTVTWSVDRVTTTTGEATTTDIPRFDPLGRSVWDIRLAPVAGLVHVMTVPKTPDVTFQLGGETLTTNLHGVATARLADLNNVTSRIRLLTDAAGSLSVSLLRVTKLPPGAVHQRRVLASLLVSRPVRLRFVDSDGVTVPVPRVAWVRLKGDGRSTRISGRRLGTAVMLPATTAVQVESTWRTRDITYSISTARVDGANAVFNGRQRFDPNQQSTWQVRLSVFRLSLTVRDVLFGRRTASTVTVTLPDGTSQHVYASTGKPLMFPALVRGVYKVKIGAAAVGSHSSVLVSRDGAADFRVLTRLDAVVIAIALAGLVVALISTGRALAGRPSRRPEQDPK